MSVSNSAQRPTGKLYAGKRQRQASVQRLSAQSIQNTIKGRSLVKEEVQTDEISEEGGKGISQTAAWKTGSSLDRSSKVYTRQGWGGPTGSSSPVGSWLKVTGGEDASARRQVDVPQL
jgi:hypothetical protein